MSKIETKIKFPVDLDMTPYTTEGMHNGKSSRYVADIIKYQDNLYEIIIIVIQGTYIPSLQSSIIKAKWTVVTIQCSLNIVARYFLIDRGHVIEYS